MQQQVRLDRQSRYLAAGAIIFRQDLGNAAAEGVETAGRQHAEQPLIALAGRYRQPRRAHHRPIVPGRHQSEAQGPQLSQRGNAGKAIQVAVAHQQNAIAQQSPVDRNTHRHQLAGETGIGGEQPDRQRSPGAGQSADLAEGRHRRPGFETVSPIGRARMVEGGAQNAPEIGIVEPFGGLRAGIDESLDRLRPGRAARPQQYSQQEKANHRLLQENYSKKPMEKRMRWKRKKVNRWSPWAR